MTLPDRPMTYAELRGLGVSRTRIEAMLGDGSLRRVLRGVYCRGDLPDSIELRAAAASLVMPKHAVVSDRSAAWLHGIDCFDYASLGHPPDLEVVSIAGNDRVRRTGTLGGKRDLTSDEVCAVGGVLVTTPLRTACDLACLRGRPVALAVLDAFMRHHKLTRADFVRVLRRYRGRRGVKQLRELIGYATPEAESPGESWVRMEIVDAGLPAPKPQVWVRIPGVGRFRLDLAYRHLKVAVEYDGEEFHTSDRDREADRRRRKALRDTGWIVIVVTKDDLAGEALESWLGELRAALRQRRPVAKRVYSRGESWGPYTR